MKKIILTFVLLFGMTLTACEKAEQPLTCPSGYEIVDGACKQEGNRITCSDGYELNAEGTSCELIVIPVDCEANPYIPECLQGGPDNTLNIFYINDFHGAILKDDEEMGFAAMANFLKNFEAENPNTIFVAGGDILQGSALSNYYLGESTIEILDLMGLDSFALGNHEFDWGLEEVTKYFDEVVENGEADFPLLAANVFFKGTETRPDHIEPFTILETRDFKVGVIGTIGANLEGSIATKRVEEYEFVDPLPYIEEYAIHLRTVEECDFVIVTAHDTGTINDQVVALTGDAKIDAVFNGHSHADYAYQNQNVPIMQSGGNGEFIGHVQFEFTNGVVTRINVENYDRYDHSDLRNADVSVQALIDLYFAEATALFEPIITAGDQLNSGDLSEWMAKLMRTATNSDIAFQNYGGTRSSINLDTEISEAILYDVWPFDNAVKTVYLTGEEIESYILSSSDAYSTEIADFEDQTLYKVATNDYIFDKVYNPFINGLNIEFSDLLQRDLVLSELVLQAAVYDRFYLENNILTTYTE